MTKIADEKTNVRRERLGAVVAMLLLALVALACKPSAQRTPDDASTLPAATVSASPTVQDEAADIIAKCGKPTSDFVKAEGDGKTRHVVYKKQNIELLFIVCAAGDRKCSTTGQTTGLIGRFPANDDPMAEPVPLAEARRRLPCAKESIRDVLERE